MFEKYFKLSEHDTTVRIEAIAGLTTFLTMAYIIFVNPQIIAATGMDKNAVFVATCVAAAFGTLVMGFFANYPIALAPGMGLNAFFTFTIVLGMKEQGVTWQIALAAVFVSGVIFIILSVLPFREWLINAIPKSMKMGIAAGIGFFLAFIGLKSAGIIVASKATFVTTGDLTAWPVILAVLGFVLIAALDFRKIPGAIIIGILLVTVAGMLLKVTPAPSAIVSLPPSIAPTFLQLDFVGLFNISFAIVGAIVFSFLLVDFFDTAGTLVATTHQAGLLDSEGKLPKLRNALLSDSSATVVGSLLGTSTTTSYIESASGIKAGGRTGLTAVFVAILFLLALFFAPVATSVPAYATAPAIVFVACLMARALTEIEWDDATEYAPAIVTAIAMPLTFSIATGIGMGFIAYALIKVLSGKWNEIGIAVILIALLFLAYFLLQ